MSPRFHTCYLDGIKRCYLRMYLLEVFSKCMFPSGLYNNVEHDPGPPLSREDAPYLTQNLIYFEFMQVDVVAFITGASFPTAIPLVKLLDRALQLREPS